MSWNKTSNILCIDLDTNIFIRCSLHYLVLRIAYMYVVCILSQRQRSPRRLVTNEYSNSANLSEKKGRYFQVK